MFALHTQSTLVHILEADLQSVQNIRTSHLVNSYECVLEANLLSISDVRASNQINTCDTILETQV